MSHAIRVGVGGWVFEGWDETFYPPGLPAKRQLDYMSRRLTATEVNATFYRAMPASAYAKWAEASPDGFVFCLKAHRFAVTRKTKDEMKVAIDWFVGSGVSTLGAKLGPINWQFQNRAFDPDYFDAFLSQLPKEVDGLALRHALEVRHPSFDDPRFFDLLTRHGCTVIWADDDAYPKLRHEGAAFAMARLMRTRGGEHTGYPAGELSAFAKLFKGWSKHQDVFAFIISGEKALNPLAAMALQRELGIAPGAASLTEAEGMAGGKTAKPAAKAPAKAGAKKAPAGPTKKSAPAKSVAKSAAPAKKK